MRNELIPAKRRWNSISPKETSIHCVFQLRSLLKFKEMAAHAHEDFTSANKIGKLTGQLACQCALQVTTLFGDSVFTWAGV